MTKVLQRPTLILNRNWQPVNVATVATLTGCQLRLRISVGRWSTLVMV